MRDAADIRGGFASRKYNRVEGGTRVLHVSRIEMRHSNAVLINPL